MAEPQFNPESPPELIVSQTFNTPEAPTLAALKGKVVVLVAFQMLCPGSLRHALPQAERLGRAFNADEVAVLGLHMVFENHADMTPSLLEPVLKSEHITIPILVDQPNGSGTPKTMEAYGMQGTPTLLVFDRQGRLRRHYLGAVDDVRLGAEIMALCLEAPNAAREVSMAIEQRLAAALVDPHEHHHHHDGECCGGHDHDHDHAHEHAHEHGPGCDHKH
jgi:Redoxin